MDPTGQRMCLSTRRHEAVNLKTFACIVWTRWTVSSENTVLPLQVWSCCVKFIVMFCILQFCKTLLKETISNMQCMTEPRNFVQRWILISGWYDVIKNQVWNVIWFKTFTATWINKIFSGYMPCHQTKTGRRFRAGALMMGTEIVLETSVSFSLVTRLYSPRRFY
jgi:hypothetical protein